MAKTGYLFLIAIAIALAPALTNADENSALGIAVGAFDMLGSETTSMVQLEYSLAYSLPLQLQPFIGGWITLKEDNFLYAGLQRSFSVTEQVWLMPSFAVGGYNLQNGKNLGEDTEFQSRIELGYQFSEADSIALQFAHISNGGLDKLNPGSEILLVSYRLFF